MESSKILAVLFVVLLFGATQTQAANILCLMGAATESYQIRSHVLFKALADRGHHVSILGEAHYIKKLYGVEKNIKYFSLNVPSAEVPREYDMPPMSAYGKLLLWYDRQPIICQEILSSKNFFGIIRWGMQKTRPFDLILYDMVNAPGCMLSLAQLFKKEQRTTVKEIPLVALNLDAKILHETFEVARGGEINYAAVPFFLSNFDEDMWFSDRLYNLFLYAYSFYFRYFTIDADIYDMTVGHIFLQRSDIKLNLTEVMKRVKIVLVNSHPVFNYAQPLPPNVIEIAGWHITEPKTISLEVFANFDDKNMKGIIFISLGSSYKIDGPLEKKRVGAILKVIRKFPNYVFIWKIANGATIKRRPANLYLSESLLENDVLAHPQTKLYFTIADSMKLHEAIYHGVPVIATPLLIDQLNIAKRVWERGLGVVVDFGAENFSEDIFLNVLTYMIINYEKFKTNAERMKFSFRNRSQPPLDTAIWWIEALLENPEGFDNLVSPIGQPNYFVSHAWDIFVPVVIWVISAICANSFVCYFCIWKRFLSVYLWGLQPEDMIPAQVHPQAQAPAIAQVQAQEVPALENIVEPARAETVQHKKKGKKGKKKK